MVKASKSKPNLYTSVYDVLRMKIGFGKLIIQQQVEWAVFSSGSRSIPAGLNIERVLGEMVQNGYLWCNVSRELGKSYLLLLREELQLPREIKSKDYSNVCGLHIAYDVLSRKIGYGSWMSLENIADAFHGDTGISFPPGVDMPNLVGDLVKYKYLLEDPPGKYLLLVNSLSKKPITRAIN